MIADIIAQDSEGRSVLVVVVRGMHLEPNIVSEYFEQIERECPNVPFAMLVDPTAMYVKKQGPEADPEIHRDIDQDAIIRYYDPDEGTKRIFRDYRVGLMEIWLMDIVYHWKSQRPPESDKLAALGLLDRLEKGDVYREVPVGADAPLR